MLRIDLPDGKSVAFSQQDPIKSLYVEEKNPATGNFKSGGRFISYLSDNLKKPDLNLKPFAEVFKNFSAAQISEVLKFLCTEELRNNKDVLKNIAILFQPYYSLVAQFPYQTNATFNDSRSEGLGENNIRISDQDYFSKFLLKKIFANSALGKVFAGDSAYSNAEKSMLIKSLFATSSYDRHDTQTVLHMVVEKKDTELLKQLITLRIPSVMKFDSLNKLDMHRMSPLDLALQSAKETNDWTMVMLLFEHMRQSGIHKENLHAFVRLYNAALTYNKMDIVNQLAAIGFDPTENYKNSLNQNVGNALYYAVDAKNTDTITALLKNKKNFLRTDASQSESDPLLLAADNGFWDAVKLILTHATQKPIPEDLQIVFNRAVAKNAPLDVLMLILKNPAAKTLHEEDLAAAFIMAIRAGQLNIMENILTRNFKIPESALHEAAESSAPDKVAAFNRAFVFMKSDSGEPPNLDAKVKGLTVYETALAAKAWELIGIISRFKKLNTVEVQKLSDVFSKSQVKLNDVKDFLARMDSPIAFVIFNILAQQARGDEVKELAKFYKENKQKLCAPSSHANVFGSLFGANYETQYQILISKLQPETKQPKLNRSSENDNL